MSTILPPPSAPSPPVWPSCPCATRTGSAAGSKARARSVSPRRGPPCWPRSRPRSSKGRGAHRPSAPRRVPAVTYPEQLPVSQKKDEILEAIRDHQVVIVAGETGSGKTTQIPKICLELGRGVRGMIGHTQPRRIAARTVAERVAEELRHPARRGRRLEGPLHRPGEPGRHLRQADDGRHPARRDPDGPRAARLRHDHHRRGPRAVPQHRLPARAIWPSCCPSAPTSRSSSPPRPSTPSASPGTSATRRSSRSAAVRIPVEVRYRPLLEEDGEDADRDQITAICDAVDELQARGPGRHPRLPLRRAGDPRHRGRAEQEAATASPRCCRCTRGSRTPSSTASSSRTPAAGSFWRRTSPRPR